jgi:ATP-dependent RNA helicase DDX52/ROK1
VQQQPLRITVGERNSAATSVKQRLVFVGRENGKLLTLRQMLGEGLKPPVLVFVSSKERARQLHKDLMYDGFHVDSIHADQPHASRAAAVENFRLGKTWVLIATDLIGRGMDFVGVNTVVSYDFPYSTADYVHRWAAGWVGVTGTRVGPAWWRGVHLVFVWMTECA